MSRAAHTAAVLAWVTAAGFWLPTVVLGPVRPPTALDHGIVRAVALALAARVSPRDPT